MDLAEIKGRHALVTVDYFSGLLTYDALNAETSDAVMKVQQQLQNRKFGLPEKILSDNGPCFRFSDSSRRFCEQLDISHVTSSPYHHQSNGRAEIAVETVERILKKYTSEVDITKALTTYFDTPVNGTLSSLAELFLNRRINTQLSMNMTPVPLTDHEKAAVNGKRSAHPHIESYQNRPRGLIREVTARRRPRQQTQHQSKSDHAQDGWSNQRRSQILYMYIRLYRLDPDAKTLIG